MYKSIKSTKPITVKHPLEKAREDFVEKISVAGWREAVNEDIGWIRYSFRIVLLLLSCGCSYYVAKGFVRFFRSGFKDDITDFDSVPSIPMPNVTLCAQIYLNETLIRELVRIPESILQELRNHNDSLDKLHGGRFKNLEVGYWESDVSLDEFYRQFTVWLSLIARPRRIWVKNYLRYAHILRANADILTNTAELFARAVVPCEKMFSRCWFDSVEFDCCTRAVRSIDDDGVCYILALNKDSDNARPTSGTVNQRRPGPAGGLTVEMSVPLRDDFPWYADDAQNGFRVIVGPVPYSFASSPVLAPDLSETFVKVTPERRILSTDCAPRDQLRMPGGEFMYYDPEGLSCIVRDFEKAIHLYTQCHLPLYLYTPNASISCDPIVNLILTNSFTFSAEEISRRDPDHAVAQFEKVWKRALSDKARCPNHCEYWTYNSMASFIYLDPKNPPKEQTMFSKIHVYYGDMAYRQHRQVKEVTEYLAFCDFGNVVMLYWGMSTVSFLHVIYYTTCYVRAKRKYAWASTNKVDTVR